MSIYVDIIKRGRHKGKYRMTHSVSGFVSRPMGRDEAILHIHETRRDPSPMNLVEESLAFPEGWYTNGW